MSLPGGSLFQEHMFMCVHTHRPLYVAHGEQGLEALAAGRRLSSKSRLQRGQGLSPQLSFLGAKSALVKIMTAAASHTPPLMHGLSGSH